MILAAAALVLAVLPWWAGRRGGGAPDRRRHRWDGLRRRSAARASRRAGRRAATPDPAVVLDLVDVALAAGASIPDALQGLGVALAPAPLGLTTAGAALRLGARWQEAWVGSDPVLEPLVAALEPAWLDGADPGPLVRRAAAGVRARRQRAAREAAERLGARLVLPLGLCFLPAFVLLSLVPVMLSGGRSLLGG